MKPNTIAIITIVINLLVGNSIISRFFNGKYETLGEKISIHIISSMFATIILILLFKIFTNKIKRFNIISLSLLGAFLVPVLSIYTFGFFHLDIVDASYKGLIIASLFGFASWMFWLPFGILNSVLFIIYSKSYNST